MQFETVWEKYNCLDLATTYFTKRMTFMQELMCDCTKVGKTWIQSMASLPQSEIESKKFEKTVLSIDPAATNKGRTSDYTAMTVLGKCNNLYFVRSGSLYRFDATTEFDLYIDTVINTLHSYSEITHIFLERNVFKGIDEARIKEKIEADKDLRRRNIQVISIYNNTNKDQRISTITDKINSGQCIFNEYNTEYNKQIKDFKGQYYSEWDDAADSLEMAINNIDKIKVIKKVSVLPFNLLF